jgi:hypothetical protein
MEGTTSSSAWHPRQSNPFVLTVPPKPPAVTLPVIDSIFTPRSSTKRDRQASPLTASPSQAVANPLSRVPSHSRSPHRSLVSRMSTTITDKRASTAAVSFRQAADLTAPVGSSMTATMGRSQPVAAPHSTVFTAPVVPSICFPGRTYYGGSYYAPPRTNALERMLTYDFFKYTTESDMALAARAAGGGRGLTTAAGRKLQSVAVAVGATVHTPQQPIPAPSSFPQLT